MVFYFGTREEGGSSMQKFLLLFGFMLNSALFANDIKLFDPEDSAVAAKRLTLEDTQLSDPHLRRFTELQIEFRSLNIYPVPHLGQASNKSKFSSKTFAKFLHDLAPLLTAEPRLLSLMSFNEATSLMLLFMRWNIGHPGKDGDEVRLAMRKIFLSPSTPLPAYVTHRNLAIGSVLHTYYLNQSTRASASFEEEYFQLMRDINDTLQLVDLARDIIRSAVEGINEKISKCENSDCMSAVYAKVQKDERLYWERAERAYRELSLSAKLQIILLTKYFTIEEPRADEIISQTLDIGQNTQNELSGRDFSNAGRYRYAGHYLAQLQDFLRKLRDDKTYANTRKIFTEYQEMAIRLLKQTHFYRNTIFALREAHWNEAPVLEVLISLQNYGVNLAHDPSTFDPSMPLHFLQPN
jgi:hypothetical protein